MAERFDLNVRRAGELFIKSLWIQGQMADLNIFESHPDLVEPFLASMTLPRSFVELRFNAWQADFSPTKVEFVAKFSALLTAQDIEDLEFLNSLRNAIGHSHLSLAQDYFLYRPRTKSEGEIAQSLLLQPKEDASIPMVVKVSFTNDAYFLECYDRIKRLDETCLSKVATKLGVRHSRIR